MSLSIVANVVSRYTASIRTAGLKEVTFKEFQKALANAGWPAPEYSHTKRTMDAWYMDRGVEVAHKSQVLTRGKVTQETYSANPDYLGDKTASTRTAFFLPYKFDEKTDVEKSFAEAKKDIAQALKEAEKLLGVASKYEKQAKKVQKDAPKVIEAFVAILEKIDPKRFSAIGAECLKLVPQIRSAEWTIFLGVSNPITSFFSLTFEVSKRMRTFLKKNPEGLQELEKFFKGELMGLSKDSYFYTEFEHVVEPVAEKIASLLKYNEIMLPLGNMPFSTSKMEAYNGLHEQVMFFARYPLNDSAKAEARFKQVHENLAEMSKLIDSMKKDFLEDEALQHTY